MPLEDFHLRPEEKCKSSCQTKNKLAVFFWTHAVRPLVLETPPFYQNVSLMPNQGKCRGMKLKYILNTTFIINLKQTNKSKWVFLFRFRFGYWVVGYGYCSSFSVKTSELDWGFPFGKDKWRQKPEDDQLECLKCLIYNIADTLSVSIREGWADWLTLLF